MDSGATSDSVFDSESEEELKYGSESEGESGDGSESEEVAQSRSKKKPKNILPKRELNINLISRSVRSKFKTRFRD